MSLTKVSLDVLEQFENISISNSLTISGITDSTTKTTGALVISGGVGVSKRITAGSFFTNTISAPTVDYTIGTEKIHASTGVNIGSGSSLTFGDGATPCKITATSGASGTLSLNVKDTVQVLHAAETGLVVGTGTAPAATLDVRGTALISGNTRINSLGIGTNASGTAGEIRATNEITAFYSSDKRLKTNIVNIENALEKIMSINGVMFDWTDEYISSRGGEDGFFVRKKDTGLIADEVELILPELVAVREDGYKGLKYEKMQGLIVESIKELKKQIDQIKEHLGMK